MARGRIEFRHKETGEQINVFASSVQVVKSFENDHGNQVTLVKIGDEYLEVEENYDTLLYRLKDAGCDTRSYNYFLYSGMSQK